MTKEKLSKKILIIVITFLLLILSANIRVPVSAVSEYPFDSSTVQTDLNSLSLKERYGSFSSMISDFANIVNYQETDESYISFDRVGVSA